MSSSMLEHLARGVLALSHLAGAARAIPPYPKEAQYVLDLIVRECLHSGLTPPSSLPELIGWCVDLTASGREPIRGVDLIVQSLVHPVQRVRTRTCTEVGGWSAVSDRIVAEVVADIPDEEARRRRAVLASHVLITSETSRTVLMKDPRMIPALKAVKDCYLPAPEEWIVRGKIALCPTCGLLARSEHPDYELVSWCETETCPRRTRITNRVSASSALVLHPALRLYHVLPARTEQILLTGLKTAHVVAHPSGDHHGCYTIRAPNPAVIRVYDRIEPGPLARDSLVDKVDIAVVPQLDGEFRKMFQEALPGGAEVLIRTVDEIFEILTGSGKEFR
ncbi:hypothetical protein AB0N89_20140 [Amycolatopsis sp. NPDC089917]|uniref:pPIWI_RE_Y domain-containing protein n=1 Tax=Amycolatopsis sp. NPDC089917 TaxID=3155187 RepID=UPI00343CBBD5